MMKNTGIDFSYSYVSVDLFVISAHNTFKNVETLSDISRYSNGRLFYYPGFNSNLNGMKLDQEFTSALTANIAWEGVGRVRVSSEYRQMGTFGHYLVKSNTRDLLSLPCCDENRQFFYELEKQERRIREGQ